jgi:thiol:disulfide interchange protein DsbD
MKRVLLGLFALHCSAVFAAETARVEIEWATDLPAALKRAENEKKWVFVDFYTDWCGYCKKLDREVFSDDKVKEILSRFILVHVDGDRQPKVRDQYEVDGYPNLLMLNSKGVVLERIGGFLPKDQFLEVVEPVSRGIDPLDTLKKRLADNPDDGKIQLEGGIKGVSLKQYDLANQALERAVKILPSDDKNHVTAMVYLLQSYLGAGMPAKTEIQFAEIQKVHPGVIEQKKAKVIVGMAHLKAGNREEAIRIWESSLSELENDGQKEAVRRMISDAKVPSATAGGVVSASKEHSE